ncbi:alpha/beta fold hydrolase [Pseudoduganella armeniaca]|uniref:Alpha/beta hydrolase n=1 Tax=Pseudoduganella armeniaca TaxID=2072590 RepID=A0A2R4CGP2_9BURK|nr:alpha/beta hydrolase [Pseudoduganella armeniaca]AVR98640.1 alpha/beta hydrolase [Pseudoduganella armeniaca]
MSVIKRNNVRVSGTGSRAIVFAHGFGCDQAMWRLVAPAFEPHYRVVLFDHLGAGGSDLSSYDPACYDRLEAYADDVVAICDALHLERPIFVGHSVSAMIGIVAAVRNPLRLGQLVLVGPSPCYINDDGYVGGYTRADIEALLDFLDDNYVAWARMMAPTIMGNTDRPELGTELQDSFCLTDPTAARQFARVTFLSDTRSELDKVQVPTLILQCDQDAIAPAAVGDYVHAAMRGSTLVRMKATGHCPHLSAPEETIAAIRTYLDRQ